MELTSGQQVKLCELTKELKQKCSPPGIVRHMDEFFGSYVTIENQINSDFFKIQEDRATYTWHVDWIEGYEKYERIIPENISRMI